MRTTLCFLLIALAVAQICAMPAGDKDKEDPTKKATDAVKGATDKGKDAATGAVEKAKDGTKGLTSSFSGIQKDVSKLVKDGADIPMKAAGSMATGFMSMFQ